MTNNFLLLNSDKTEILLIGPKNSTQNLLDYNLHLDRCPVTSSTVKNLGVILDSNLSFENHISHVTKTAFFHLRNIAKLRNMLPVSDAEKLVHAFMTSRLDYCNALLGGCPASSINKLQIVQNAVLTRSRKYDYITPICYLLLILPIKFHISYKILLLTFKALNQWSQTQFLEGHSSAEFSSNQPQITPAWKFLVILKTLISWIRCVWLGLEQNCAELWPSSNWVWDQGPKWFSSCVPN